MDFGQALLDGMSFTACGKLSGKVSFLPDDDPSFRYYLRIDYVGGTLNVEVDERQYTSSPATGTKMRIKGQVSQHPKTGAYTMKTNSWQTEHEPNFAPFTLQELQIGASFFACGWVIEKRSFTNNTDGRRRNQVRIKTMGGVITHEVEDVAQFNELPGAEQPVTLSGTVTSQFIADKTGGSYRGQKNNLQLNILQVQGVGTAPARESRKAG